MIVPRNRLLIWVAVLLPLAAVAPSLPELQLPALAAVSLLVFLAIVDAFLAPRSLRGLGLKLPEVVRLSKDAEGRIPIEIKNGAAKRRRIRIGLPFPAEIRSSTEDLLVALPEKTETSSVGWPCTPSRRGNYVLEKFFFETSSPLGFWDARASSSGHSEIRVYPNLTKDRKKLAAFFLNRGNFGVHSQRVLGKGRDFEKLREYIPGDSYDEIHWKATAKRGRPVTKLFQIERTQEVYVIVDASRLSAKEIGVETCLERYITSALILGLAAEQQGDHFGILAFSDRVDRFIRASSGKAHYNACRDALYTLHSRIVSPNFDDLCSFIRVRLRRRALILVLTNLNDPVLSESFLHNIPLISRQHLVLVNMIQPAEAVELFREPQLKSVVELHSRLGGHILWHNLRELGKVLQTRGARLTLLQNEKMSAQLVSQYLSVKQRQIL